MCMRLLAITITNCTRSGGSTVWRFCSTCTTFIITCALFEFNSSALLVEEAFQVTSSQVVSSSTILRYRVLARLALILLRKILSQVVSGATTVATTMCSISQESSSARSGNNRGVAVPPLLLSSIVALIAALLWRSIPSISGVMNSIGLLVAGVFGFLTSIVLFAAYYSGPSLRKASTQAGHISALVKKATPVEKYLQDLDKLTNPEGLSQLWKDEIQANEKTFKILLTGVTGYVGRAFLFQLLREIAQAEQEGKKILPHKVYVMARGKARKNLTASDRLKNISEEAMFASYKRQWDAVVVAAQSGDLQEDKCGMSDEIVQMLTDAELTHVVHCAADVNFNRPLPDSAGINISPALQLQALAAGWPSCTRFVHCSTAFVNPGCGTKEKPLPEALFSLGSYDPQDLYDSMRGDQKLALKVKEEFGFPNNYVLTKCVAEHLVVRHNDSSKMELRICRPAVVGPAWVLPEPGWNGDKPSTISGVFLLWGTRVVRFAPLIKKAMPVIPVDVVAAGIIHAMIRPTDKKEEGQFPVRFHNLIWSHKSKIEFTEGVFMAKETVQSATMFGHFSATEAALSLVLLDIVALWPATFDFLHMIFNQGPLYLLQFVCWSVRIMGIKTVLDKVPVVALFKFSDMLTLYKPYMGRYFNFESPLMVPESFSMSSYSASLLVAAHGFITKMFPGAVQEINVVDILPKGRLDLWWALTQPCSSFKNRFIGYLASKVLRVACASALIDNLTVEEMFAAMVKMEGTMADQKHCVVLVSNNRSVMDYVLVKYVIFFVSAMGLDVPQVLAKPEFEDPALTAKLGKSKSQFDRHISLAAFLEGSPSPDGRMQKPIPGSLEKIVEMEGDQDYTLVPMSLGHNCVNDSEILLQATKDSSDIGLAGMLALYWQICVMKQAKPHSLGDVTVSFGTPVSLESKTDLDAIAADLHSHLQILGCPSR